MNLVSKLSRLLITFVTLSALAQVASFSYAGFAGAAGTVVADPIDLALPARHNEMARFALSDAIVEQYGIIVADRTAQWQLDELSSLKSDLDQMADRLSALTGRDGQRVMKRLFEGTAIYRDRHWRDNIAYAIGGTVSVYDVWARFDTVGRTFYLAHELGHVLDAEGSPLHLLMGEVSETFARNVGAYRDARGVYHLGRNYPLRDPRDRPRHRTDNAAEDWAESFATVIVPAFEADLRNLGEAREQEVRRMITQWAARVFKEH